MSQIKLACFDVDGVVLDSYSGMISAINKTIREFGGEEITEEAFREQSLGSFEVFMFSRGISKDVGWQKISDSLDENFNIPSLYQEREGAREVFSFLKSKNIKIFLMSACNEILTTNKIKYHDGLIDYVDGIYGTEDKGGELTKLLVKEKVSPSESIFITDMERDLHKVEPVGVAHNIAIVSQYSKPERLRPFSNHLVVDNQELLSLLKKLI